MAAWTAPSMCPSRRRAATPRVNWNRATATALTSRASTTSSSWSVCAAGMIVAEDPAGGDGREHAQGAAGQAQQQHEQPVAAARAAQGEAQQSPGRERPRRERADRTYRPKGQRRGGDGPRHGRPRPRRRIDHFVARRRQRRQGHRPLVRRPERQQRPVVLLPPIAGQPHAPDAHPRGPCDVADGVAPAAPRCRRRRGAAG